MARLAVITVGLLALVVVATATATQGDTTNIEPSDRVRGMRVVQGPATRAQTALFGIYCEPITTGRHRETCRDVPRFRRLFVGYGIWASKAALSRLWKPRSGACGSMASASASTSSAPPIERSPNMRPQAEGTSPFANGA